MRIRSCNLVFKNCSGSFWILILLFLFSITVSSQNTYTVNSTDDTEDIDLADNKCMDINGNCTLRAAMQNANKFSVKDKIDFKIQGIGPFTIKLNKNLPPIKQTLELIAVEAAHYSTVTPQIVLDGTGIEYQLKKNSEIREHSHAFQLTDESSGSTIKGFAIVGFSGTGISVYTDKNLIQSNLIGSTKAGQTGSETSFGILIRGSENLIGGSCEEDKNVISGTRVGIFVYSGNTIIGNYIGTTADGCSPMANRAGIALTRYSENNLISDNLISGNVDGIHVSGDNNTIVNNRIGTNAAGTEKIPNTTGITLSGAVGNLVGGRNKGNLISGNERGIIIEDKRVPIDQNNKILNNFIGTDFTGNFELGNETGILIKSGNVNWIGGFQEGDGNLISGNTNYGIEIRGAQEIIIAGNYIGPNINGTTAVPNSCGIKFEGDPDNLNCFNNNIISNLISGNSGNGIEIQNAEYLSITGNLLGTQKDGVSPLPNRGNAIVTGSLAQNNCIGGTDKSQQNIIKLDSKNGFEPPL